MQRSIAALLFLIGQLLFGAAEAQGSRAEYERALGLEDATRGTVFRDRVSPHWLDGGPAFWYLVRTGPGTHEFILVNPGAPSREPAFDHARLADALASAAGEEVKAAALPFSTVAFAEDRRRLRFEAFGSGWTCDLETYKIGKSGDAAAMGNGTLKPLEYFSRSRSTGEETRVLFVNTRKTPVKLHWMDTGGQRQAYGTLAPGEKRSQHTYAGHVWLVTDAEGRDLTAFTATEDEARAVIGDATLVSGERPRRGGRRDNSSPNGRFEASIVDNNVRLRTLSDGAVQTLSTDGSGEDPYEDRFYWSPDGMRLAVMQVKQGENRQIHLIESSPEGQLQPKLHTLDYAKPGDRMPVPRPRLFDIEAMRQIPIDEGLFPNAWSISEVRWAADSCGFTFFYNQRGHQVLRVVAVDAATGSARAIIDEHSGTFIDYAGKRFTHYLDGTNEIIWMSERDGWNHLYLYDAQTGVVKNQITKGEWVVRRVEKVDEDARQLLFRAGGIVPGHDPYYLHLCRVNFDGTGLTVLSEGDGNHSWSIAPDGGYFIDTWSRVDQPPVSELRRMSDGTRVLDLERADWKALLDTGWRPPERFIAKARDGVTDIYGIIIRPPDCTPDRKYPVLEKIYAGPHGAFVPKSFDRLAREYALAELGFIVVQIDGMGTSFRSKAFHDFCWKNLGGAGFPDRILWMQAAAATYPEFDLSRVGIYGVSAGGQSALRGLLAHGDFYRAGVADCGCHDNRMDKIWWNELWMGWPIGPEYEEQSNVTQAHRLTGGLFLIVGELDKNVDPASTMQVVDALIKADKDFDLLVVPGAGHGAGNSPYGRRRTMDFFVRHLMGREPRWEGVGE